MHIFTSLTSKAIPLNMHNVDTDMIIPAQFLTKINRDGYGEHLFQYLKKQDANFVFHDPKYQSAQILLTGANFGCGSSREHAVWALMQAGISVIIAESYSDIFYNNATTNGLLAITLAPTVISRLMEEAKLGNKALTVDLQEQTIKTVTGETFHFNFDPFRKECFLKGQDDLDYLLEATK